MITDTACQRSCCGENWMTLQANLLQDFRLQVYEEASQEKFQFGAGNPVISDKKIWVPSAIEYVCMVFGINVLPADIPFLGSLRLMKRLGAVIDLNNSGIFFSKLDVTSPLCKVGGHLAVEIVNFPPTPHRLRVWSQISDCGFEDPEVATVLELAQVPFDAAPSALLDTSAAHQPDHHGLRSGREKAIKPPVSQTDPLLTRSGAATETGQPTGIDPIEGLPDRQGRHQRDQAEGLRKDAQCSREIPPKTSGKLQTSRVPEVRQQARQIRQMHNMPSQMAVGRNRMEVGWLLLQTVAAATIFLDSGGWFNPASGIRSFPAASATSTGMSTEDQAYCQGQVSSGQAQPFSTPGTDQIQATIYDLLSGGPSQEGRRDGRLRPADGRGEHLQLGPGHRKRLRGETRKVCNLLEAEVSALQQLPAELRKTYKVTRWISSSSSQAVPKPR